MNGHEDSALLRSTVRGSLARKKVEQLTVPPNLIPWGCETITPGMLPLAELESEHIQRIVLAVPGGARNIQDIYPLTPAQEGMLFHHMLGNQRDAYLVSQLLELDTRERLDGVIRALQRVVDRHDVLRSAILWEELPRPMQVVLRHADVPVETIALDGNRDPAEQMKERVNFEHQRLDLRKAPLVQLKVAADSGSSRWYVLFQQHHIISDHESLAMLCSEVKACLEKGPYELSHPVPYRNHVAQSLALARRHDAEEFFRRKLGDVDEPTTPFGLVDVHGDGSRVDQARKELESELAQRVRTQARRYRLSVASLFHAAWGLVMAHTAGQEGVVYGTVLFGRLRTGAKARQGMGLFLNTLPLRLHLRDVTTRELVEQTQRELHELLGYEQSSLAIAQRCSAMAGSAPLFTAILNYRHTPVSLRSWGWAGIAGVRELAVEDRTNYPITLSVDDWGEGFEVTAHTDRRIDSQRTVAYIITAMQSLVEALERTPQTPALSLSILPTSERRQVLKLFNCTDEPYPQDKLVHELFEDQVQRTPGAVAVVYEGDSLTYTDLNAKANQLAWYLRERGIGPDQLVGICVERSLEMVVGLLGILKAGGAYVPLDPNYPLERLQYMLGDAAPNVLLTQEHLRKRLPSGDAKVIALDEQWDEIAQQPCDDLDPTALGLMSHHLAYVIYTSGSTGRPKGAMNEHRGVVNRLQWMQHEYRLGDADRVLQKTPFSFDVSGWEFFWTLMSGAQLIVARPEGHKDSSYLRALIEETGVTTLHFVPSMLQSFLDQYRSGDCSSLRHIVCSGEELPASLQRKCFKCLPQARLSNLYGPTEAAIDVTAWECSPDDDSTRVPIGRPISNIRIYVLGSHRQPVPIGVPGEIYIAGVGVARGYLNRLELTAERFINDPFSSDPQARLYKTGDLGRWRADGSIEYLGRNDHQVKIRGFRIELGEIEAQLLLHPQVKEAVVLAREDEPGEKRLVAYVVGQRTSDADSALSVETLRGHLKPVLPDYMLPSAFVTLESLPLTPNGKLDRRALPRPDSATWASKRYEAPQGRLEETLAEIWQKLLQTDRIGRDDDFFELGGHSLLGMKFLVMLTERLAVQAPIVSIFQCPTIRRMGQYVSTLLAEETGPFALASTEELEEGIL